MIARRERPHPGAQLRITDADGWRITLFATNTVGGRLADLECATGCVLAPRTASADSKDTGLTNLPLQAFAKNEIWLELAALADELLTWTQLLAWPDHPARSWEPKRLRLRLLSRGRANHHHRAPAHPAPQPTMALDRPDHHRPPTPRRADLTSPPRPDDQGHGEPADTAPETNDAHHNTNTATTDSHQSRTHSRKIEAN